MPFVYIKSDAADRDLYAGQPICSVVVRNDNGPAWGWTYEDSVHAELGQKKKAAVTLKESSAQSVQETCRHSREDVANQQK
jgi:hypothetical protein